MAGRWCSGGRRRWGDGVAAPGEAIGQERGYPTLVIARKGGKVVTVPPAPRTARAIDLAVGERCEGPVFLAPDGRRLDRHGAGRTVRRIARRAGLGGIKACAEARHQPS